MGSEADGPGERLEDLKDSRLPVRLDSPDAPRCALPWRCWSSTIMSAIRDLRSLPSWRHASSVCITEFNLLLNPSAVCSENLKFDGVVHYGRGAFATAKEAAGYWIFPGPDGRILLCIDAGMPHWKRIGRGHFSRQQLSTDKTVPSDTESESWPFGETSSPDIRKCLYDPLWFALYSTNGVPQVLKVHIWCSSEDFPEPGKGVNGKGYSL